MKRLSGIMLAFVLAIGCAAPALADVGDVAGRYYSTDIRTFLNGVEIDAINVGGQTLIRAEDMGYYSFSVYWNEAARQLDIYKMSGKAPGPQPVVEKSDLPVGAVLGHYYETDILTRLDGKPITAYNTGGRTYIHAEQMRDWGYVVEWNAVDRTLSITSPDRAGYEYSVDLSEGGRPATDALEGDGAGAFAISYGNGNLAGCGDAVLFDSSLRCDGTKYSVHMSFYQNEGLFFSAKLQDLLNAMCYSQYGEKVAEPEEKYEIIAENTCILINGHKAENVKITKGGGNGHVDFAFEITDIPVLKEDEIESIWFSVGSTEGMEVYDIELREGER